MWTKTESGINVSKLVLEIGQPLFLLLGLLGIICEPLQDLINGVSERLRRVIMVDIFGEKGKHARAAVGMNSLPSNIAVEIEMIVEIEN